MSGDRFAAVIRCYLRPMGTCQAGRFLGNTHTPWGRVPAGKTSVPRTARLAPSEFIDACVAFLEKAIIRPLNLMHKRHKGMPVEVGVLFRKGFYCPDMYIAADARAPQCGVSELLHGKFMPRRLLTVLSAQSMGALPADIRA